MATTKDLSNLIDHQMGPGQGQFLVRICQDAGLLPKAKPGGWRSMKDLTAEQGADFVIALAGTRAVGERNANGARMAVERFGALTTDWGDWEEGRGVRTLREDIAYFLGKDQFELEVDAESSSPMWIMFVNDEHYPWAEIRLVTEDLKGARSIDYLSRAAREEDTVDDPEVEPAISAVAESAMVSFRLIIALGHLLFHIKHMLDTDT